MSFISPYIGNVITPTDQLHHFSKGLVETTNQTQILEEGSSKSSGYFLA
jgi:hypothetical protein